ncbi:MAG: DUF4339 domain-containing protein [Planctomycetota bacterium]
MVRRTNGRIEGPYTSAELRAIAHEGRLSSEDMVSREGESNWVSTMRVHGIREILELLAPPPVPMAFDEPDPPASAVKRSSQQFPPEDDEAFGSSESMAEPRRRPSASKASDTEIPHYSVLRCVAGWLSTYGWIIVALALGASIFVTCKAFFEFIAGRIDIGLLIALLVASLVLGFLSASLMRRQSQSKPVNPWFIAMVFMPLVPTSLEVLRAGAFDKPAVLALVFTPILAVVGTLVGALVTGMLLIAVGQFAVAHADIATNSWKRLA